MTAFRPPISCRAYHRSLISTLLRLHTPFPWDATYDYIVVGGGTAGVTVASRLAEKGHNVALVEAGGTYEWSRPLSRIPGAATIGIGADVATASSIDWKFVARRVPGANYRDIHYPRGKCLGGSPSEGAMNKWAELVGDVSYSFNETLTYFKRTIAFTPPNAESSRPDTPYNSSAFDSKGEPLRVSYPQFAMPFSTWARQGFSAIGIEEIDGFDSGKLQGHQFCAMTIHPTDETRSSSDAAFLYSGRGLKTLSVYQSTRAEKVLFDSRLRATGVRVSGIWRYKLWAKQEVILSAGVFQSPQLLMLSGVGPGDTLLHHGIKPVVDAPGVGQNMWDHVFFGPSYPVSVETFSRLTQDPLWLIWQAANYLIRHEGVLTNPSTDYLAFEKLPQHLRQGLSPAVEDTLAWFPGDWPEIEYLAASAFVGNFSNPFFQQPARGQYGSIVTSIIAPTSRGNVTLRSRDAKDLPIINPNWLDTESDQKLAIAAYRRIREVFQTTAMKAILTGPEYFPGLQFQSDADILNIIRNTMMTIYHASCTCKMGMKSDRMAVVDHRARVFGVERLRVVDASAFPLLPPGHPQSVVYMLAEKIAADIINSPLLSQ
ncbi:Versicolorin B synthase [Penicillium ucsense]|uniref:Versicolorin B synthase n=1 Tax=Penicillium ucsense TaxID=2839758 RepID=A0A8J8W4L2_9EURO|nr:Versicolorin B synthase [Penicillium ucsense]KAF7736562.1 Versicolorin B synthase [Penicillium ucsense]